MAMFNTTQVPIQEPMYINGQLSQVWLMFFLRLSQVVSVDDQADLAEITQMAHQLPPQALQNQTLLDLSAIKDELYVVPTQQVTQDQIQPLQAVFLLPEFHAPLAIMPSSEILNDSI